MYKRQAPNARVVVKLGDRDLMALEISGITINKPSVHTQYFLLLTPKDRPWARPYWLATRARPADRGRFLATLNPYGTDGLEAYFPSANLPAGTYRVSLLRRTREGDAVGEVGSFTFSR